MSCMSQGIAVLKVKTQQAATYTDISHGDNLQITENGIRVFPNPVKNGRVTVHIDHAGKTPVSLFIYGSDGRLFHSEKINAGNSGMIKTINITELPAGVYTVQVLSAERKQVKKFIKTE